jgi:O-methyltransferase domain/IclR helix-turn-helix domain
MAAAVLSAEDLDRLLGSYRLALAVRAFVAVGLAERLAGGPATADELAASTGCHPPTVFRLLRALASEGVLAVDAAGAFALTPASARLAAGHPQSSRAMLLGWRLLPATVDAYGSLAEAVRTGQSPFAARHGMPFYRWLDGHPEVAGAYEAAMESTVSAFDAAAGAYPFPSTGTVVDVGGGQGALLVSVLRRHPGLRGVLFDLPRVVAAAAGRLAGLAEAARIEIVAGDLLDGVPAGGDVYLLSTVLRCFDDDECVAALRRVAAAMGPAARLAALENVLPDGVPPPGAGLSDLDALVVYGGRDRTAGEWESVLRAAGLRLDAVTPVDGRFAFVVGRLG